TGNQPIYTSIEGAGINYNHSHNITINSMVFKTKTYTYETKYIYYESTGGTNYNSLENLDSENLIQNLPGINSGNGKVIITNMNVINFGTPSLTESTTYNNLVINYDNPFDAVSKFYYSIDNNSNYALMSSLNDFETSSFTLDVSS